MRTFTLTVATCLLAASLAHASDEQIASAESAGPGSVSNDATVKDWSGNVLREGSNGWVCLPDRPDTPGNDPWCVDASWQNFLDAYTTKTKPSYDNAGIAYMLMGDTAVSNTDPYATEKTNDADWVEDMAAHLMVLAPGKTSLAGYSEDPNNGGPWVMWPRTPYQHLMVPLVGPPK